MTISDVVPDSRLQRFTRWLLDTDGELYGDERERLRWYEGIAMTAGVQWVVVPLAAAVGVWLAPGAVWPLVAVVAVLYLSMMLTSAYVAGRGVPLYPLRWSGKRVGLAVVTLAPYLVFVVGAFRALGRVDAPTLTGMVVGLACAVVAFRVGTHRRRRAERQAAVPADGLD